MKLKADWAMKWVGAQVGISSYNMILIYVMFIEYIIIFFFTHNNRTRRTLSTNDWLLLHVWRVFFLVAPFVPYFGCERGESVVKNRVQL